MALNQNNRSSKPELNKDGTPRKHGNTVPVTFRIDKDVLSEISLMSEETGIPQSKLIRNLILYAMRGERIDSSYKKEITSRKHSVDLDTVRALEKIFAATGNELAAVQTELQRIGNNLNQIAKKINSGDAPVSFGVDVNEFVSVKSDCENILNTVGEVFQIMKGGI